MKTNKQLWYALLSSESAFWLSVATKIKVITTANQKRGKYVKEPTKTQNKNNQTAKSAGKRGRPIRGLVSHLKLVERVARVFCTNHRATLSKNKVIRDYLTYSIEKYSKTFYLTNVISTTKMFYLLSLYLHLLLMKPHHPYCCHTSYPEPVGKEQCQDSPLDVANV